VNIGIAGRELSDLLVEAVYGPQIQAFGSVVHRTRLTHILILVGAPNAVPGKPDGMKRLQRALGRIHRLRQAAADAGMTTAEYAVGTVAAVAFAVVLYKIVQSDAVSSALSSIISSALHSL
jgi:hypothetical protein